MYDKKQALGFILIIMVVMTYTQFVFTPNQQAPQNSAATSNNQGASSSGQATTNPQLAPNFQFNNSNTAISNVPAYARIPSIEEVAQSPKTIIHTDLTTVSITHLGARIKNLGLNKFNKELNGTESYDLISHLEGASLPAGLQYGALSDEGLKYEVKNQSGFEQQDSENLKVANNSDASITFAATLPSGQSITKTFSFKSGSYVFNITGAVAPSGNNLDTLTLSWPINVSEEALHARYDPYFFSLLYDTNKVSHIPAVGNLTDLSNPQSVQWLAFGDRYFETALLPSEKQKNVMVTANKGSFDLFARGNQGNISVGVFAGPKMYQLLKNQGLQLDRTIDLGFFSFVAYPLLQLLKFLYSIFGNWGVAIVALTLLVKTIFYPLNKASLKSMRAMQELGPEIAALKERVKDSTQLNQEMLALYKRKGVNPMGGCLPIGIQIPVFFGLYSALQNAVELRHAPFALWVKDLATPEKLHIFGINVPVIVLTMGAIMFVQQYRTPMPNMDPNQRKVTLAMSLVFTLMFLVFPFPAGLAIYMLVNTTISLVQQQCLRSETMNQPFRMTMIASVAILAFAFIFSKL